MGLLYLRFKPELSQAIGVVTGPIGSGMVMAPRPMQIYSQDDRGGTCPGGAILDLDGVIADTGWAHRQAWSELASRCGTTLSEELFVQTFGMQNYQIIPMLLGKQVDPAQMEALSSWKEQRYRQIVASGLQAPEGLARLLAELKGHGLRLAIGSSAPAENVELVLGTLGVGGFFDAIVHGGMVARGKPAPDTFLLAARLLDLPADMCVVVEDAVAGVEAARAAGMAVIALTTTRPARDLVGADMVVDGLGALHAEDFLRLIDDMGRGINGQEQ